MLTFKDLQKFSLRLNVLCVEDNDPLREEAKRIVDPFFVRDDLAKNAQIIGLVRPDQTESGDIEFF